MGLTEGAAQKRGPDLHSGNCFPMADDPAPLVVKQLLPDGPYDQHGRTYTPRKNAVEGCGRAEIYCKACGERFATEVDAAMHVAETRHQVVVCRAFEIVPVDLDDHWELWEDGSGVSWCDRNPEPRA